MSRTELLIRKPFFITNCDFVGFKRALSTACQTFLIEEASKRFFKNDEAITKVHEFQSRLKNAQDDRSLWSIGDGIARDEKLSKLSLLFLKALREENTFSASEFLSLVEFSNALRELSSKEVAMLKSLLETHLCNSIHGVTDLLNKIKLADSFQDAHKAIPFSTDEVRVLKQCFEKINLISKKLVVKMDAQVTLSGVEAGALRELLPLVSLVSSVNNGDVTLDYGNAKNLAAELAKCQLQSLQDKILSERNKDKVWDNDLIIFLLAEVGLAKFGGAYDLLGRLRWQEVSTKTQLAPTEKISKLLAKNNNDDDEVFEEISAAADSLAASSTHESLRQEALNRQTLAPHSAAENGLLAAARSAVVEVSNVNKITKSKETEARFSANAFDVTLEAKVFVDIIKETESQYWADFPRDPNGPQKQDKDTGRKRIRRAKEWVLCTNNSNLFHIATLLMLALLEKGTDVPNRIAMHAIKAELISLAEIESALSNTFSDTPIFTRLSQPSPASVETPKKYAENAITAAKAILKKKLWQLLGTLYKFDLGGLHRNVPTIKPIDAEIKQMANVLENNAPFYEPAMSLMLILKGCQETAEANAEHQKIDDEKGYSQEQVLETENQIVVDSLEQAKNLSGGKLLDSLLRLLARQKYHKLNWRPETYAVVMTGLPDVIESGREFSTYSKKYFALLEDLYSDFFSGQVSQSIGQFNAETKLEIATLITMIDLMITANEQCGLKPLGQDRAQQNVLAYGSDSDELFAGLGERVAPEVKVKDRPDNEPWPSYKDNCHSFFAGISTKEGVFALEEFTRSEIESLKNRVESFNNFPRTLLQKCKTLKTDHDAFKKVSFSLDEVLTLKSFLYVHHPLSIRESEEGKGYYCPELRAHLPDDDANRMLMCEKLKTVSQRLGHDTPITDDASTVCYMFANFSNEEVQALSKYVNENSLNKAFCEKYPVLVDRIKAVVHDANLKTGSYREWCFTEQEAKALKEALGVANDKRFKQKLRTETGDPWVSQPDQNLYVAMAFGGP